MKQLTGAGLLAAALALSANALATTAAPAPTVSWALWGSTPVATLAQNGKTINVSYDGAQLGISHSNHFSRLASFTGAEVTNTAGTNGVLRMEGGNRRVNTIRFSQAVYNPYLALVSVGAVNRAVNFEFQNAPSISLLSFGGGDWGGGTLALNGSTLTGQEGNGVLRFNGWFKEISFVTPQYEYWFGATVGAGIAAVPEPSSAAMLLGGLAVAGLVAARRRRAARTA